MGYQHLCFVNFKQFADVNAYTRDLGESLLFGHILYQLSNTKLTNKEYGVKEIARKSNELAKSLGLSLSTLKRKLKALEKYSLICIAIKKWFGKKRMFISAQKDIKCSLNIEKLKLLNSYTGDTKASIALSYFAYQLAQADCHTRYGKDWCYVPKKDIAELLRVTQRTAHIIVKQLELKGLIDLKGQYGGEAAFLVRIKPHIVDEITNGWELKKEQFLAEKNAKQEAKNKKDAVQNLEKMLNLNLCIKNRDIDTIYKNNNIADAAKKDTSDVNFKIELTKTEKRYVLKAFERTVLATKCPLVDLELLKHQVMFAMQSPAHRRGTQGFKHAVNRFMFLIRRGGWKMPFGYEKYSDECKEQYQHVKAAELAHYQQKDGRALANLQAAGELPPELNISVPDVPRAPVADVISEDEERKRKLADLERRWQESRYGRT